MFEYLVPRPADAIMALMEAAKADPNPHKIDLGVGIYKDDHGATTVMKAVKEAEKRWLDEEGTKKYVSTVGRADFRDEMSAMVFGADNPVITEGRLATAQAAGGSGALRLGAEIIKSAAPDATVWVSTPTWANHVPLISSPGLKMEEYPYYNRETLGVDFEDMLDRLKSKAKAGDVVLLHGCCHNPSGTFYLPRGNCRHELFQEFWSLPRPCWHGRGYYKRYQNSRNCSKPAQCYSTQSYFYAAGSWCCISRKNTE